MALNDSSIEDTLNTIRKLIENCEPKPNISSEAIARLQREDEGHYSSTKAATYLIWNIVPMVLFIVGMLGNILTVVIIARQRRMTSTTVYLLALAVSDMLLLCNAPLRQWIRYIDAGSTGERTNNWRLWSLAGCKTSLYLTYSSLHLSSWILVAVTMERVISVLFPHWVKRGSTPKSSMIVILVLIVAIFGLNSHYLYGYGVVFSANTTTEIFCEAKYDDYFLFAYNIWPVIDTSVTLVVPFVFLVTGNTMIICRLRRTQTQRREMGAIQTRAVRQFELDSKVLTVTLVLLAVVFFICLTPVQLYLIFAPDSLDGFNKLMCEDLVKWRDAVETNDLWYGITNNLGYLNASFNFVLYVISGSKFRDEIKALFLCRNPGEEVVFGTPNLARLRTQRSSTTNVDTLSAL